MLNFAVSFICMSWSHCGEVLYGNTVASHACPGHTVERYYMGTQLPVMHVLGHTVERYYMGTQLPVMPVVLQCTEHWMLLSNQIFELE